MENSSSQQTGINIIKSVIFCIFAVSIVAGNFFLENSYGNEIKESPTIFSEFKDEEDNIIPEKGVIRFNKASEENSTEIILNKGKDYIFDFKKGQLWGDFSISDANVNIIVGNVVVMPNKATFDLIYKGTQMELAVYGGDVYLGFIKEGTEIKNPLTAYDKIFINRILVPQNTQVRFSMRQINKEIEPLLYSKLSKELRLSSIPTSKSDDPWVKTNRSKDFSLIEIKRQNFFSEVIRKGKSIQDSFFGEIMFFAEEKFTFFPDKKEEMIFNHLFSYLDDAIYYAVTNNRAKSEEMLAKFYAYKTSLPQEIKTSEKLDKKINKYIEDLFMFDQRSPLYALNEKLLNNKFLEGKDKHEIVNFYWLSIYRAMEISEEETVLAFEKYHEYFSKIVGAPTDQAFYIDYLTYKNQLLDSLLLRTSVFYKDAYFEAKNSFEKILLENYEEGRLKEEIKQLFISNKIELMKRLRSFFFDGEIVVLDAKEIFGRLIAEVKELMPAEDSGVAVIRLFQSQLEDIIDFWGYLESGEYHTGAFGPTHKERYQFYLEERDLVRGVEDLLRNVLGEEVGIQTVEEAITTIESQLIQNSEIYDFEVVEMKTPDQRNIKVRGVIGGYPFDAVYDRYQNSLKEIYVYGELISERPMKINGLLLLLESRFSKIAEEMEEDFEEITMESIAQRIARKHIVDTLKSHGFIVEMGNVLVVDKSHISYRVKEIFLEEYRGIKTTFDLKMTGEGTVSNLFMDVYDKSRVFDGEHSIQEVKDIIKIEENIHKNPTPIKEDEEEEEDERIAR